MDFENLNADVNCILTRHYTAGRGGYNINKVVIHYNAGDLTVEGCYSVWQNREASAHYQVESSGRIGQLVNDWDTAWHAGDWAANCSSIGIEHANKESGYVTDECLDAGAHLVAAICKYYGLGRPEWCVNVFPHSYFSATSCPGRLQDDQRDAYMSRAQQWYDNMVNGADAPSGGAEWTPSQPSGPSYTESESFSSVPVHYALHVQDGDWLPVVTDFNNSNGDGFAGMPFCKHDMLIAWVDEGLLSYQVHTMDNGWLDMVDHADWNDDQDGMAGIWDDTIDGVRMYYTTPDGVVMKCVWYRSQTTMREGYLDVVCDDGTSWYDGDDFAGILGEPLDRLQVCVSNNNPF